MPVVTMDDIAQGMTLLLLLAVVSHSNTTATSMTACAAHASRTTLVNS